MYCTLVLLVLLNTYFTSTFKSKKQFKVDTSSSTNYTMFQNSESPFSRGREITLMLWKASLCPSPSVSCGASHHEEISTNHRPESLLPPPPPPPPPPPLKRRDSAQLFLSVASSSSSPPVVAWVIYRKEPGKKKRCVLILLFHSLDMEGKSVSL